VRITAQLIELKDQSHLWSREYDRELKDLLSVQSEIARQISREIQLSLKSPLNTEEVSLTTQSYTAYDLYLRGLYSLNKRSVPDLQAAISDFQQAITADPGNARAYAGLADAYSLISGYTSRPQAEFAASARSAASKALQIDDKLAEAHTAMALIVQNNDFDWETAEKEFRRAIELNPNYATAHHWYAEHLMWRGRFEEALAESERARQLDPLSLIVAADNGAILYYSRQYDRAIEKWRSVLAQDALFPRAHLIQHAYIQKKMFAEALADLEQQRPAMAEPYYWATAAYIYGEWGKISEGRGALGKLLEENRRGPIDPRIIAQTYVALGDKEQALAWLEKAYAAHSNELVALKVSPSYDSLRGDPRFADLLHRVGLTN
jgi:tetratricopeptide (TPR) repeat protein